jgi:arginyl-tRNA synthetase
MQIVELIRDRFRPVLANLVDEPERHLARIATARDASHGDYQANLAMPLAKPLGRDAVELANSMLESLQIDDLCETTSVAGKGFINLKLKTSWVEGRLTELLLDDRLGVDAAKAPKTFIVDFSSPNVAKPMHVGHIRSTFIGDSISKTLKFLGHHVITDNHLGDWGTQFGMIIFGYKHFVDAERFESDPINELGRLYRQVQGIIAYQKATKKVDETRSALVLAKERLLDAEAAAAAEPTDKKLKKATKQAQKSVDGAAAIVNALEQTITAFESDSSNVSRAESCPDLERQCLAETARLHEGDSTNTELWQRFMPMCLSEIHRIYDRVDIQFDHEMGESFYHEQLPLVVNDLVDRKLAQKSDGAVCVFLPNFDAPMIIQKKDGAFLYATTDIATVHYRMKQFSPDAILYVVDHRQAEHFAKLFATCRAIGIHDVQLNHISFGTVLGKDGKPFKTRSGDTVGLDSLLDEAIERAWKVACDPARLRAAQIEMTESEQRQIANAVGIGAIKYADLSHSRTSDYVFDLDKMVSLEGNTATYIQYSYARTRSILGRSDVQPAAASFAKTTFELAEPIERELAMQLLRFEEALTQSVEDFTPNIIANYLFDLAKLFASFFDRCPVLKAESDTLKASRLGLVFLTGQVLAQGLTLLGIETVERM